MPSPPPSLEIWFECLNTFQIYPFVKITQKRTFDNIPCDVKIFLAIPNKSIYLQDQQIRLFSDERWGISVFSVCVFW